MVALVAREEWTERSVPATLSFHLIYTPTRCNHQDTNAHTQQGAPPCDDDTPFFEDDETLVDVT